jgi:hypothetical protein
MTTDPTLRDLYLSAVLSLWERGMDTWQIAKTLNETQANTERALHAALDKREKLRRFHGETT